MAIVQKALEPVRDWRQYRAWMALQPPKIKPEGETHGYRSTLALAGASCLDGDEIPPASPSLHESALYNQPVSLKIPALDETRVKWERDRSYQASKYGGSLQATVERARFAVELPVSPQHRKYCYDYTPEVCPSVMAAQVAKEAEEAQEEERKIARRNSLQRIQGGGAGLSPLLQETLDPSRRNRIVEKLISKNKFLEDALDKMWEELEQAPAAISSRAIALKMMQKIKASSNCPASLEANIFNYVRSKHKEFVKEKPELAENKDGFIQFCRANGLLLEYDTDGEFLPVRPTPKVEHVEPKEPDFGFED
mmetsp:Transcript_85832/g.105302  ORF Transcript_85832/g.105302 Transcript_85832/m.105302 type:complete len:309 (+) Transcript_85832:30-956(+)